MLLCERLENLNEAKIDSVNATPLIGVDKIKFGMSRDDIRTAMAGYSGTFNKTKAKNRATTDDYGFCHVYFDGNDNCIAVEVFDNVQIKINGAKVTNMTLEGFKNIFPDLKESDGSHISESKSVGIELSGDKVKSVLFGTKGYYSK